MISLAEANFAAGDFSRNVQDQVKARSQIRLGVHSDNIAGVQLPKFTLRGEDRDESDDKALLGLTGGGQAITKCRSNFKTLLKLLTQIASYQTQFITLDEVIKVTNRRVNALEYVVVPGIADTISYIDKELDEQSREDFFRLKRVQDKKKIAKDQAARKKELEMRKKMEDGGDGEGDEEEGQEGADIFGGDDDDDVVF